MSYKIGKYTFKLKELSLRDDEKLANIINDVFNAQQNVFDEEHKNNLVKKQSDIPFIQTQFVNDAVIITGGFLSKLLETKAATTIAEMFLQSDSKMSVFDSILWRLKTYRLYYLSRHIKGDLKGKIFTDFFSEGTVYAANLVNHFLILLTSRIAQQEELKHKN